MFFSENFLARGEPLANIWLAAHYDKKLTKAQIQSTDIPNTVQDIISGQGVPMALRLTGQLLLGTTKIYSRKTYFLWDDCTEALNHLNIKKKEVDHKEHQASHQQTKAKRREKQQSSALAQQETAQLDQDVDLETFIARIQAQRPQSPSRRSLELARDEDDEEYPRQASENDFDDALMPDMPMGDDMSPFTMDTAFGVERPSIEVGRRDSGLVDGPLSSPMRRSTLSMNPAVFDQDDAFAGAGDDGQVAFFGADDQVPDMQQPPTLFSSPKQEQETRVAKIKRTLRKRLQLHAIDEVTEMTNSQIRRQVSNTEGLLQDTQENNVPEDGEEQIEGDMEVPPSTPDKKAKVTMSQASRILDAPLFGADGGSVFDGLPKLFATKLLVNSPVKTEQLQEDNHFQPQDDVWAGAGDDGQEAFMANESLNARAEEGNPFVAEAVPQSSFALPKNATTLDSIIPLPKTRSQAAKTFFDTLFMASTGKVRVEQSAPFGSIFIASY